jgi:hypothetical protein
MLLIALMAATGSGCTGSRAATSQPPDAAVPPAIRLPGPAELARGASGISGAWRSGRDYLATAPHAGVPDAGEGAAEYAPAAAAGAYAIYHFTPRGYDHGGTLRLSFDTAPERDDALWVGISDFSRGTWEWQRGTAGHAYSFDATRAANADGEMYAAIVASGTGFTLAELRLGAEQALAHPRLYFTAAELPALQAKADALPEVYAQVYDFAADVVTSGYLPDETADPDGDLNYYRNAGRYLYPLALAYLLSGEQRFLDTAVEFMRRYAGWEQIDIEHNRDLGHSDMLLGMALAYDWLYPHLSVADRDICAAALGEWAEQMWAAASATEYNETWRNWWALSYLQNHCSTNHSSLGIAALALYGDDPRADKWLTLAVERMAEQQYMLDGIGDGTWHEGIGYQSYMFTMALPFLTNLRKVLGRDIIAHRYFGAYGRWRAYNLLPETWQFLMPYSNYEWYWGNFRAVSTARFCAAEYGDGLAQHCADHLAEYEGRSASIWNVYTAVFELLYYDPDVAPTPPGSAGIPLSAEFPDLAAVIWRTGWGADDLAFGFKTGPYGGFSSFDAFMYGEYPWGFERDWRSLNVGHDHDDMHGFYLTRGQHWLAPESVSYGESPEIGAGWHNTLVIDGQSQYRPQDMSHDGWDTGYEYTAGYIEAHVNLPSFDYLRAEGAERYLHLGDLDHFTRHVLFVRPGYFVVVDNLAAGSAHDYEWCCHFEQPPAVDGNWVRGDSSGGNTLGLGVALPSGFSHTTGADGGADGRPWVRLSPAAAVANARFAVLLYPTAEAEWDARPVVSALHDDAQATVLRGEFATGVDDTLITHGSAGGMVTAGTYATDARAAYVRTVAGEPRALMLVGGTELSRDSMTMVSGAPGGGVELGWDGAQLSVAGGLDGALTVYAPAVAQVLVNGAAADFVRDGDYITVGE